MSTVNFFLKIPSLDFSDMKNDRESKLLPLTKFIFNNPSITAIEFCESDAYKTRTVGQVSIKPYHVYVSESDLDEFVPLLPPTESNSKIEGVLFAHYTQTGLHYGVTHTYDEETGEINGTEGSPIFQFKRAEYIDYYAPNIEISEGNFVTLRSLIDADANYVIPQVVLKKGQAERDLT